MAMRLILQESRGIMVKICACPMLWGPFNKKVWSPSPSCSSTSSSCNSCCCIHNNTGFLVYDINGDGVKKHENIASCYGGTTIYKGAQMDDWIISLAKFGVTTHNVNQNTDLEFVRVVGASHTGLSSLLYHITLEATSGRKHRIFHAVVWLQPLKNSMELLVWRSIHDALSVVGVKRGDLKLHEAVMHLMNLRKESYIPGLIT